MPTTGDSQRFRNEELVLKVSQTVDRARWDESRYEAFIDELCGSREYQKEAIRTALRYLLGGRYPSLRALAQSNFEDNLALQTRYGSWEGLRRHLQFPDQLAASLDMATGSGKSYVLFGIAAVLLSEGAGDRVLLLCPSTTIEAGLTEKFRDLASSAALRDLLPADSKITTPRIINASESITEGCICIENYHAVLEHVGSSIRESLWGKGAHTAVLNDEAHHVVNESTARVKRWKEFLSDPGYGFRYIIGVSGTCYVGDDYFADVIYRYSLRQAMEERYVKWVNYIAEMPRTGDPDEKWQLIHNRHEETRRTLTSRKLRPLTIIVTPTITRCKDVAEDLRSFLVENAGVPAEAATEQVLVVYNNASDILRLPYVDSAASKVEWIVAVSMLNEGWDVKRVFQIVPHEERAFNSKLLIAQVLGRGLRIPDGWKGEPPEVTVFNHDAWAPRIRHLVNEILEFEKRLSSRVVEDSSHHFDLHTIDYALETMSVKKEMTGDYRLFAKGFVDLATESPTEEVSVEFERAATGERHKWQTRIKHKTYSPREIAEDMYRRLEEAQDSDEGTSAKRTPYTDEFPVERLEEIVKLSLAKIGAREATESMKQKFLQSLGPLRRKAAENVRYIHNVNQYVTLSTKQRQADSVSASELRTNKTVFHTEDSRATLLDEQLEFFDEVTEPGAGFKVVSVPNANDFKTPLNLVIADHDNERRFINMLLDSKNVLCYHAWIKSTSMRFYEIEYAWKKGEHPKRATFNPDFFIRVGDLTVVVEIKDESDLVEPSEENRKKNEYAQAHFRRLNTRMAEIGSPVRYKFTFLTDRSYTKFFQSLREGTVNNFRSEMDVKLESEE